MLALDCGWTVIGMGYVQGVWHFGVGWLAVGAMLLLSVYLVLSVLPGWCWVWHHFGLSPLQQLRFVWCATGGSLVWQVCCLSFWLMHVVLGLFGRID